MPAIRDGISETVQDKMIGRIRTRVCWEKMHGDCMQMSHSTAAVNVAWFHPNWIPSVLRGHFSFGEAVEFALASGLWLLNLIEDDTESPTLYNSPCAELTLLPIEDAHGNPLLFLRQEAPYQSVKEITALLGAHISVGRELIWDTRVGEGGRGAPCSHLAGLDVLARVQRETVKITMLIAT